MYLPSNWAGIVYTWSAEFELDSFRQKMDEQGMAVAENQESSLKSRRKLAETTRGVQEVLWSCLNRFCCSVLLAYGTTFAEFKKGASAELNKDVGALLKAYQEEVDRLTTRYSP